MVRAAARGRLLDVPSGQRTHAQAEPGRRPQPEHHTEETIIKKKAFLILENPNADGPLLGPGLELQTDEVFDSIDAALEAIQADVDEHYLPDPDTPVGDPDTNACSRKIIVQVVRAMRPVPTLHVTWEFEHETV